ncbi:MAG TPA: ROK family protein [Acidimicrobiales bacterium]|nr:ROK family protein [Acidimicrobiales bacterium]
MGDLSLAVDIGGTKMAAGLVDRDGRLQSTAVVPTPPGADAAALWAALSGLVGGVLHRAPGTGAPVVCGVGCGGPMDAEGVSPLNIPGWRRYPLRQQLAGLTGLPTFVDNDAKALALGEGWVGAARGRADYVAMVVSTGVGGGIVLDGRLLDGRLGNAGHIGHVVVEPDGRRCACGGRGCLEAEASGTAIAAVTGRPPAEAPPEVVARTGTLVGRAVASVATLLDLDLAVVAGSVALGFGAPFFAAAAREVRERAAMPFSAGTVVEPAGLGGDGPLVGAAAVGWRGLDGAVPKAPVGAVPKAGTGPMAPVAGGGR